MSYLRFKPGTTLLTQLPSLSLSILSKNKRAPQTKIRELQEYVKNNNVKWIPDSTGNGAYFISTSLSASLGKKESDFINFWSQEKLNLAKEYLDYGISPKVFKLKGEGLVQFKLMWHHYRNEILNDKPELWVQEWSVAHAYLKKVYRQLPPSNSPTIAVGLTSARVANSDDEYLFSDVSEENLKQRIIKMASYQRTIKLSQEMSLANDFKNEENNTAKNRRIDILEQKPNRYYIGYELKLEQINDEHVREALGHKGYLELLRNRFKGRKVKFVFISPNGISPAAKRLIKNNPYVEFISVRSFVDRLVKQVLKEAEPTARWYFTKLFGTLFPQNKATVDLTDDSLHSEIEIAQLEASLSPLLTLV